ncbi:MAG: hypothetical protein ABSE62_06245 [Chthoniobacteraceae bacterium]|jgi:hypothetical protein
MKHLSLIEPLEDRIAPALILNPYTVTFQDGSGGTAVIRISKPLFKTAKSANSILQWVDNNGNSITETYTGNSTAENISEIDLLGNFAAQGMNISVRVVTQVGIGGNTVNVGSIAAANFNTNYQVSDNIDLGSIYIQGNLGSITAGDGFSPPVIKSLTVQSMGSSSSVEQSIVLGPILNLNVQGNFYGNLAMIGYRYGSISKLYIGGSLTGDTNNDQATGVIQFTGGIGSATIGNITGTSGTDTGELEGSDANPSKIGSLTVLGSITGSSGFASGQVYADTSIGRLTVDGSLVGSSGIGSGSVQGKLGSVSIGGDLTGGSGLSSGSILSATNGGTNSGGTGFAINGNDSLNPASIRNVMIGGDVTGGSAGVAAQPASLTTPAIAATPGESGVIYASSAKSIVIGGSLIGGTSVNKTNGNGIQDNTADTSGAIVSNTVKTLVVGDSITGGDGPNSGAVVGIGVSSLGSSPLILAMNYGTIIVNGDVTGAAGSSSGSILVNGLVQGVISNLHIGGNVMGEAGSQSGEIDAGTGLKTLFIGGNLSGGAGNDTGEVMVGGLLGTGTIMGNLAGGSAPHTATAALTNSGYIQASQIGNLTIHGSVSSGLNAGAGGIANSGAIRSNSAIGSLTIDGTVTGTSADPVFISAAFGPQNVAKQKTDVAIQTLTINGAVNYLDVLAGYNANVTAGTALGMLGTVVDGSAQMGTLTFGSTLNASNIVAGINPDSNTQFGTAGNTAITSTSLPGAVSSIAKIVVAGAATGDSTLTDSFGIEAVILKSVSINGSVIPTDNLMTDTPELVSGSVNLYLLEVTPP